MKKFQVIRGVGAVKAQMRSHRPTAGLKVEEKKVTFGVALIKDAFFVATQEDVVQQVDSAVTLPVVACALKVVEAVSVIVWILNHRILVSEQVISAVQA